MKCDSRHPMKPLIHFGLTLTLTTLIQADLNEPVNIRVQTQMVEMSHATYSKLLNQPLVSSTYQATQNLISANQAKLINSEIVICRSGTKGSIESVREFISPCEAVYSGLDYRPSVNPTPEMEWTPQIRPWLSTPTAFEVRNVGSTLEIEPTVDGNLIGLRFAPEWIFLPSFTTWQTHKDRWGWAHIQSPTFYTMRTINAVTLVNNRYQCITSFTPFDKLGKSDYSRKLILFVKATIIRPHSEP